MTAELGMNLAGVERVLELEDQLESMASKVAGLESGRACWEPKWIGRRSFAAS